MSSSPTIAASIARISACGVVPVVVIDDVTLAVPLAQALAEGGIDVVEVTLRRPSAMASLEAIARHVPEVLTVAGTVVTVQQVSDVVNAGAQAVVSPGFSEAVDQAMRASGLAWLPGVATASDCMRAFAAGRHHCKFFPAEQAGGVNMLKALSGPFPGLKFCPTGGVSLDNLKHYLSLPFVFAAGGSWLVPQDAVAVRDWARITRLAAEASARAKEIRAKEIRA